MSGSGYTHDAESPTKRYRLPNVFCESLASSTEMLVTTSQPRCLYFSNACTILGLLSCERTTKDRILSKVSLGYREYACECDIMFITAAGRVISFTRSTIEQVLLLTAVKIQHHVGYAAPACHQLHRAAVCRYKIERAGQRRYRIRPYVHGPGRSRL